MLAGTRDAVRDLFRNRPLGAVIAEGFLARLAFSVISFTLPFYALSLGMSLVEIGALAALRVVAALAMKPVMGHAAARFGVKPVYLFSLAGRAAVALLFLLAATPVALFLVRTLHGVTTAARDPASALLLMEHADETRMARVFSWYATAKWTGAALGFPLAGVLLASSGDNYTTVFVFAAAVSLLALALVWRFAAEHAVAPAPDAEITEATASAGTDKPAARWLQTATLAFAIALPASMVGGLFPLIVEAQTGLGKAEIGFVYAASTAALLVLGPLFGWLADTVSRSAVLAVRSAANVLSSVFYLTLPGFWGMTVARVTDDAGKAAFAPAWGSLMSEIARTGSDKATRAKRLAYLDTAESVGEAIGPVLAGALWQYGDLFWLFAARIAVAIAAEIYAIWLLGRTHAA